MNDVSYGVHWLSFTVHSLSEDAFMLYDLLFKEYFGDLQPLGHGGRGFKEIYHTLLEFKIYLNPVVENKQYFHFEIPGQACELIPWNYFQALEIILKSNFPDKYSYTRVDLAFDDVPFTPQDIEKAILEEKLRSLAKRETLEVHSSPFSKRDNGELGTYTVNLGSRSSERMIRVYNKRGPTRLELELKDRRADLVAKELFSASDETEWFKIMISHLRDYVDFYPVWWGEFTNGTARAWATVGSPKQLTMAKLLHWIDHQVSPALSVAFDTLPEYAIEAIIDRGRKRRGVRYDLLLKNNQ
jgi:DNA relaxase NicK